MFWPYHMACRILAPQSGIKPVPPTVEAWSQPLDHWFSLLFPEIPLFKICPLSQLPASREDTLHSPTWTWSKAHHTACCVCLGYPTQRMWQLVSHCRREELLGLDAAFLGGGHALRPQLHRPEREALEYSGKACVGDSGLPSPLWACPPDGDQTVWFWKPLFIARLQ